MRPGRKSGSKELLACLGLSNVLSPSSQRPDSAMPEQLGSIASDASCSPDALAVPVSACLLSDWLCGAWPDGRWALAVWEVRTPRPRPGWSLPCGRQLLIGRSQELGSVI